MKKTTIAELIDQFLALHDHISHQLSPFFSTSIMANLVSTHSHKKI